MSRKCIRPWVLDAVARMRSNREARCYAEAVSLQKIIQDERPRRAPFCPVSYQAVQEQEIGE
jgi:hypothetical protein